MAAVRSRLLLTLLLLLAAFSPPSLLPPCVQNLARSFAKNIPGQYSEYGQRQATLVVVIIVAVVVAMSGTML